MLHAIFARTRTACERQTYTVFYEERLSLARFVEICLLPSKNRYHYQFAKYIIVNSISCKNSSVKLYFDLKTEDKH
jgi:hypothetical protein